MLNKAEFDVNFTSFYGQGKSTSFGKQSPRFDANTDTTGWVKFREGYINTENRKMGIKEKYSEMLGNQSVTDI